MGACSSCLGRDRDRDLIDEDESSRLLFDDPHHYGSFNDHHAGRTQADPQEVQRETEALQKVVARTQENLIDIFALVPQNGAPVFPTQDAKLLQYQDVLAKMSTDQSTTHASADNTSTVSDGWSEEDDAEEMKWRGPVKSEGIGPLLGGFADADSAMA